MYRYSPSSLWIQAVKSSSRLFKGRFSRQDLIPKDSPQEPGTPHIQALCKAVCVLQTLWYEGCSEKHRKMKPMLKAGPNSAHAREFLPQLPWRHYNISDLSSSWGHSPNNISFCKSFHCSPHFWASSLMNSCLLKLPSSVCCSPKHRGWWAFTSTAHKHASRPANKLAFHLPPSPVIRRKNVFCISHLKDYRSPTSIFIEGVLFLFRIVNTLCLPGVGYSAVDTVF